MFDPHTVILNVSNLAVDHPKEVQALLDAANAVSAAGHFPPSWEGITDPAKAEDVIRAHAEYITVSGEAFSQAKEQAAYRIQGELVAAVADNQEHYLDLRQAAFDAAATKYIKAVDKLPEEFGMSEVIAFDPVTFRAYNDAKDAATELLAARSWALSFGQVTRSLRFDTQVYSNNHLILEATDAESYSAIQHGIRVTDEAHKAIAPQIRHALSRGAELRLATGAEATEQAADWERQRSYIG